MNRPMEHKPEEILAAASSVFLEQGVSASTAKVAAAAGVSNGTLFNYFPTKQALIDALYISLKTDLASAVGQFDDSEPIEHRIRQVWDRWFRWAREHNDEHLVVKLLHQAGLASAEAKAAGNVAVVGPVRLLTEAKNAGMLVDLPLEHLAMLIQHHLDQAVASKLDERQADIAFHVMWSGISQPETQPAGTTSP